MNRFSSAKFPSVGKPSGDAASILSKLASVKDVAFNLSQDGSRIENIVFQLTGLGAQLVEVPTSFAWNGWSYGSSLGGRGISPGYAWIGGVHTKVWCANDGVANLYWSADDWVTVVQDTSLFGIVGPGFLNWHPPCLRYLTINGVPSWVATNDQSGEWYYAQDVAANFNANGTLKASAWVLGTAAPHVIADIGVSSSASCMVGNHGFITRTVNWTSFTDVYSGANVIGGIDTDRSGMWVAFERDTGVLLMSTNDGVTWTTPQAYVRSNEGDPYVAASSVIPTGSVCAGNGIWLITGASGYAYSYDGIHWTIQNNPLGSFYGVGFDGVKFYAVNPNNAGSPPPVIYQLLVSEIPAHRHFVAEEGMTVAQGLWLPDMPSVPLLGTDELGRIISGGISISSLAANPPKFVLVGGSFVLSSDDGVSWCGSRNYPIAGVISRIVYVDGVFLILAGLYIYATLDGRTWSVVLTSSSGNNPYQSIARFTSGMYFGNDGYESVAYAENKLTLLNTNPRKYKLAAGRGIYGFRLDTSGYMSSTNDNGVTWSGAFTPGGGKMIFAGAGRWGVIPVNPGETVRYTADTVPTSASSWTAGGAVGDLPDSNNNNYDRDGTTIVVPTSTLGVILVSVDDGVNFVSVDTGIGKELFTVHWAAGLWYLLAVAAGTSYLYSSNNLSTWTLVYQVTGSARDFFVRG